jgi:hypothetical protein
VKVVDGESGGVRVEMTDADWDAIYGSWKPSDDPQVYAGVEALVRSQVDKLPKGRGKRVKK